MGRAEGISDAELEALGDYAASPSFPPQERAALAYAERLAAQNSVPDPLFEQLREQFSEEQIIELTAVITWEICAAKFNRALEIEAQGVCRVALPAGSGS